MKFTDGNWLLRPGIKAHYARAVYESAIINSGFDAEVKLIVPCHAINHRGDTLTGPVLTISLKVISDGIISVRIAHFCGHSHERSWFEKNECNPNGRVIENDESIVLDSGSIQAVISLDQGYRIQFKSDDQVLTETATRGTGYIVTDAEQAYVHEGLSIDVGELIYGLGERFTAFIKNGQSIDIWNEDGGSGSDQTYKSIPFYLTNRGYGIFVDEPGRVSYEVASEKVDRVQFSVEGESLQYYVLYGPTPKEVLRRFTQLTGRPSLPPSWSYGLWLSTSFTTNYDESTVTEFIEGMEKRNLPLSVFHFDCFWMKGFHWVNFEWDKDVFPDPAGFIQRLKDRGLRISLWINSYVAQQSELFDEAHKNGYLLKKANGNTWQWDLWQPGMGIVDFTNPKACEWFKGHLRRLIAIGVDCFKTDFGERIPTDVVWHDGSDPQKMHNYYPYLYNKLVFETLREARGDDAIVFARSATVGCQKYPVHWGGDCFSNFNSMAASLRAGLSLGLCGFGFWSHDIGGFEGMPPAEVYKRWLAFGLLSSHSRLHGSGSYRVPWNYDEEACDVLRTFTNLKCQLMPYLFSCSVQARDLGLPLMRSMNLEYPDDPGCETLDRQYMLGPSLLVAPVMSMDGSVRYYLPHGKWTHFQTNEIKEGGQWYNETFDFMSLPLYVRSGSILPISNRTDTPEYELTDIDEGRCYGSTKGEVPGFDLYDRFGQFVARLEGQGAIINGSSQGYVSMNLIDADWRSNRLT